MFIDLLSITLYLGTVGIGFYLDRDNSLHLEKSRKRFVLWLYVFLCFGYMVGTDWRNYEPWYENIDFEIYRMLTEPLSGILFWTCSKLSIDFWLFTGIAKCCYLFSSIFLLSKITDKWMSCAAYMVIGQYAFLLICNPLRFMLALIPINYCLYLLYRYIENDKNVRYFYLKLLGLLSTAILFHNSCVMYVPILFCCLYIHKVSKIGRFWLLVSYLILMIVTSNVAVLNAMKDGFLGILSNVADIKEYTKYEAISNEAVFSIGNILRIVFFVFILITRDDVIAKTKNGWIIYGFAVIYCFLVRISILIPTGFRIPMPFDAFYVCYLIYISIVQKKFWFIIVTYSLLSFTTKAWKVFEFIPYSNSIPYIIGGHIPFEERYWNNFNVNNERTGTWDERYYLY